MNTTVQNMDYGWSFHLGDIPDAWQKWYKPENWREVELPHDWAVEHPFSKEHSSGTGYLPGGTAWYRKSFHLPEEAKGKRVFVSFEGVYKNSQVWCNSYYLGKRPYGYIPFLYDISDRVSYGDNENLLAVRVEHEDIADSRWYTGSGMTRKVHVFIADPVYIPHEGVFFTTKSISEVVEKDGTVEGSAKVGLNVEIQNGTEEEHVVGLEAVLRRNGIEHRLNAQTVIQAGALSVVNLETVIENAALWSVGKPALYDLAVTIKAGSYQDESNLRVGIRMFEFDPNGGFSVNGKNIKMKGLCIHHDAGTLGAAVPPEVWERRLLKMQESGCNAIRTSHNPQDPALYKLCDEMGILLLDEIYDEWEGPKNKWSTGHNVYPPKHQGYYHDFPTWHEQDIKDWIRRDRNYASVFAWSLGNEIDYPNDPYAHPLFEEMTGNNDSNKPRAERIYNPDKPNAEQLTRIAKRLVAITKTLDPTRPTTVGSAFPELSTQIGFIDPFDIVGYNYKEHLYEDDHKRFPEKPFYGSENSKGYKQWLAVRDNDYIFGQFLWTGLDFLGEAQGWPVRGSGSGIMTMAGFPKSEFWFRCSLWCEEPVAHLLTGRIGDISRRHWFHMLPHWSYQPGETIEVRCFTNMSEAELFLNGTSLGQGSFNEEEGYFEWAVDYQPGELVVKATSNTAAAEDRLVTNGPASQIHAEIWNHPSGQAIFEGRVAQIEVSVLDAEGRLLSTDNSLLHVNVEGPAELLGIESGNLADLTSYTEPYRHAYEGRMIVYVRKHDRESNEAIRVRISGGTLKDITLEV